MPVATRELEAAAITPPMNFRRFIDNISIYLDFPVASIIRSSVSPQEDPWQDEFRRCVWAAIRRLGPG
jgi:hypothetical protein